MDPKEEKPFYYGHRQRLRDRFLKDGFKGFAPHEVVELLLTLAIPRRDVKKAAHALMDRFGSVQGVLDAPVSELREILGLNQVAPVALKIIRETADLYLQQRAEEAGIPLHARDASRFLAKPDRVFKPRGFSGGLPGFGISGYSKTESIRLKKGPLTARLSTPDG